MVGFALRQARQAQGMSMEGFGRRYCLSRSMVNEIEHGRKKLPRDARHLIAREVDDGAVYMAVGREATGGPMMGLYLNNVDDHRIVAVLKYQEEVMESLEQLEAVLPILLRAQGPDELKSGELEALKVAMLEMVECTTAAQNTLARLAKAYSISLAEIWDKHEADVMQKGYIKKEKPPKAVR